MARWRTQVIGVALLTSALNAVGPCRIASADVFMTSRRAEKVFVTFEANGDVLVVHVQRRELCGDTECGPREVVDHADVVLRDGQRELARQVTDANGVTRINLVSVPALGEILPAGARHLIVAAGSDEYPIDVSSAEAYKSARVANERAQEAERRRVLVTEREEALRKVADVDQAIDQDHDPVVANERLQSIKSKLPLATRKEVIARIAQLQRNLETRSRFAVKTIDPAREMVVARDVDVLAQPTRGAEVAEQLASGTPVLVFSNVGSWSGIARAQPNRASSWASILGWVSNTDLVSAKRYDSIRVRQERVGLRLDKDDRHLALRAERLPFPQEVAAYCTTNSAECIQPLPALITITRKINEHLYAAEYRISNTQRPNEILLVTKYTTFTTGGFVDPERFCTQQFPRVLDSVEAGFPAKVAVYIETRCD